MRRAPIEEGGPGYTEKTTPGEEEKASVERVGAGRDRGREMEGETGCVGVRVRVRVWVWERRMEREERR